MKRVTGLGGVFFKSNDPKKLKAWYHAHLGIGSEPDGEFMFEWRDKDDPEQIGLTLWSPFPQETTYFEPSRAAFMLNYRVADLDSLLAALRTEGVEIVGEIKDYDDYGRFAWVMDPEGNRVELWEPPKAATDPK